MSKFTKRKQKPMEMICFTDDEKDLISQDFCFEKDTIKKKRSRKKPIVEQIIEPISPQVSDPPEEFQLTEKQKLMIQRNVLIRERLATIDKILELFPNLKKDKLMIVDNVLGKKPEIKKDYILEKINLKGKNFYKDMDGNIINENVDLVGFHIIIDNNPKFMFFNDIKKIKISMTRYKKKIDSHADKFIKIENINI